MEIQKIEQRRRTKIKSANTKSNEKGEEGSEEIVENSQGLSDGRHDLGPLISKTP